VARKLGIDRNKNPARTRQGGRGRHDPVGRGVRVAAAEVARLTREGFTMPDAESGSRRRPRRKRVARADPEALRRLDVNDL
jgi:hypothetical protein